MAVATGTAIAVGAGLGLLGAGLQGRAAENAANTQADAARNSNDTQRAIFEQQRKDQEPWRQQGGAALSELAGNKFMDNWQQDPGYQFRMQQGMNALQSSAAARGSLNSGGTLKALTRYGQDYATNEFDKIYSRQYNRLSALAGFGQNANSANQQSGSNYANAYGQNLGSAANAQSAAQIAQGNMLNNGLNVGLNAWALNNFARRG